MNKYPFQLMLYESVQRGNGFLDNITPHLGDTWARSIRLMGGQWTGSAVWSGSKDEMIEMFREGIMKEVREQIGGILTWQGFISEMTLKLGGVSYKRSWSDISNEIKAMYTVMSSQLLTNGSGETGVWEEYNETPAYVDVNITQSTEWVTDGTYSMKIEKVDASGITNMLTNGGAESAAWTAFGAASSAQTQMGVTEGSYANAVDVPAGSGRSGAYIDAGTLTLEAGKRYEARADVSSYQGTWELVFVQGGTFLTAGGGGGGGKSLYRYIEPASTMTGVGLAISPYNPPNSYLHKIIADNARLAPMSTVGVPGYGGAIIQKDFAILDKVQYTLDLNANIQSGDWKAQVYRKDTGAVLAEVSVSGTGSSFFRAIIPKTNTFAGTVGVRIITNSGYGLIYVDGVQLSAERYRGETGWVKDTASQADYGVMQDVMLEGGYTQQAVTALMQGRLKRLAWPSVRAGEVGMRGDDKLNSLALTFYGYVFTARSKFVSELIDPLLGTEVLDYVPNLITKLVGQCQFLMKGAVATNNTPYLLDTKSYLRHWEAMREMAEIGDAAGNEYSLAVRGRTLDYSLVDKTTTSIRGRFRDGMIQNVAGGPLEPWFAEPGIYVIDDMPLGVSEITGSAADNPRNVLVREVEFNAADWFSTGNGLMLREETGE